ncbi:MAG: hypothetical protein BMS9Abin37_1993 [Acidobacteriota bacterium]|nr:MAG: hypothetical protein BMS9Abin37_1993 [Acidobacteriota bacterium]
MLSRRLMVLVLWFASPGFLWAREKTDVIFFTNGDRIHCEIIALQRGRLTVKSIGFGTISIEWDKIAHLESDHVFALELQSGIRYVGSLAPGDEDGKLKVETVSGTNRLDRARVVDLDPINESVLEAIDGSVDIGYDFTQAAEATSWSLGAEAKFKKEQFEVGLSLDSLYKTQNDAEPVNRQNLTGNYIRHLENRWFAFGMGQVEKNENQSLEFRGLAGGGGGRRLVQTNRTNVALLAGLSGIKEKFTDTDFSTSMEVLTGFLFDTYHFNSPELQVTTSLLFLPSITESKRYRLQFNSKLRLEIVKDLFWQLALFETFDSNPPSETARKNDFGVTTSFGWSF